MDRRYFLLGLLLLAPSPWLRAIEYMPTSSYQTNAPTSTNIPNWQSGWVQPTQEPTGTTYTTGWNYVGKLGAEGGTYLGYGWVITCSHVGAGNFVLNGVTYNEIASTVHSLSTKSGTPIDLQLFQVSSPPNLPPLTLRQTDPAPGTEFALIGYGNPNNVESWGYDAVTLDNHSTPLNNIWTTNDFAAETAAGADYQVIDNDSGGGDFTYNTTTKLWELAGLNEANNSDNGSAPTASLFVQLDTYAAQIQAVYLPPSTTDMPVMPQWALFAMGSFLFFLALPAVIFERR